MDPTWIRDWIRREVSGLFKAGQMVSPVDWTDEPIDLFNLPGGTSSVGSETVKVVGKLQPRDVALVVSIERADGSNVYVIGPHGGGWAFGAFLKVVRQP